MTAKQYLQQAYRLNAKIDTNLMELERLRELSTSIPSTDVSQDRVTGGGVSDRVGNAVAKIIDFETELNVEINRFIDLKREIKERIGVIPDENLRLILQKRYINLQKWEQIAVDLDLSYRWVLILHKNALKIFQSHHCTSL